MSTGAVTWTALGDYDDIRYESSGDGIAKITINPVSYTHLTLPTSDLV